MSKAEAITKRLETISGLPSFPTVVVKLTELIQKPNTSTQHIEEVIRLDPGIASKILQLSNTLAYNLSSDKVTSLEDAIVRIGFKSVRDAVLSISVIKNFSSKCRVDYDKFWNHSLSVAFTTQIIDKHSNGFSHPSDNLYMAGLLHDIGILILDQFFTEEYSVVLEKAKEQELSLLEIEDACLGITHAEVGAMLLERWKLNDEVIDAVRYQHKPHLAPGIGRKTSKILHISDYACENQGINNGVDAFPKNFSNSAWFELGLSVDDVTEIIGKVNEQTAKAKTIFNVAAGVRETESVEA